VPRRPCGDDFEPIYSAKIYAISWGPWKITDFLGDKEGWRDSLGLIRNFGYDERM